MSSDAAETIEAKLARIWQLLDLALAAATADDAVDQFEQIAVLCDSAAATARAAAKLRAG
jgi:hypothetical protein